ncbi:MAG: hypothetical protein PV358_12265 [Acidimicrobiales bacterium]|nr:hypothetical protein [Acidimicrobiales bacterium]
MTDLSDLVALTDQWTALVHASPHATAYASPAYILTWYRHFERPGGIYAITIWHHDQLVGLAPFARTRIGHPPAAITLLVSAGTEHGDYGEPLLGPDPTPVAHAIASGHQSRLASASAAGSTVTSAQASRRRASRSSPTSTRGPVSRAVAAAAPPASGMGGVGAAGPAAGRGYGEVMHRSSQGGRGETAGRGFWRPSRGVMLVGDGGSAPSARPLGDQRPPANATISGSPGTRRSCSDAAR